ncbi:carbonic anhydrase [Asticcacaulis solisilvae]|uniref:carbonic anhydrase n=1 Tax=Asticcacaulis solisilvae TaxID=1217274 RepID=UPI003FD883D4
MLDNLIENNRIWAEKKTQVDPEFFRRLVSQQNPEYFWIGCSDSRVPANEIVNLDPGEMFVHRNVANLAPPQDANYLSTLQYAVAVLKVKHVLVVGHYGCGGVRTALESEDHGLIDHWLSPVRELAHTHRHELDECADQTARVDHLCELNVKAQVRNVTLNPITTAAWRAGQDLTIHGWVYSIANGHVTDLGVSIASEDQRVAVYGL